MHEWEEGEIELCRLLFITQACLRTGQKEGGNQREKGEGNVEKK